MLPQLSAVEQRPSKPWVVGWNPTGSTMNLLLFIVISFINVFLHVYKNILVIKSSKLIASLVNCITYTFSAVVVKFISESSLIVAMIVAMSTNFLGCYVAMYVYEQYDKRKSKKVVLSN